MLTSPSSKSSELARKMQRTSKSLVAVTCEPKPRVNRQASGAVLAGSVPGWDCAPMERRLTLKNGLGDFPRKADRRWVFSPEPWSGRRESQRSGEPHSVLGRNQPSSPCPSGVPPLGVANPPCLPHGWGADPAGHYPGFIRLLPLTQGEREPTFPRFTGCSHRRTLEGKARVDPPSAHVPGC